MEPQPAEQQRSDSRSHRPGSRIIVTSETSEVHVVNSQTDATDNSSDTEGGNSTHVGDEDADALSNQYNDEDDEQTSDDIATDDDAVYVGPIIGSVLSKKDERQSDVDEANYVDAKMNAVSDYNGGGGINHGGDDGKEPDDAEVDDEDMDRDYDDDGACVAEPAVLTPKARESTTIASSILKAPTPRQKDLQQANNISARQEKQPLTTKKKPHIPVLATLQRTSSLTASERNFYATAGSYQSPATSQPNTAKTPLKMEGRKSMPDITRDVSSTNTPRRHSECSDAKSRQAYLDGSKTFRARTADFGVKVAGLMRDTITPSSPAQANIIGDLVRYLIFLILFLIVTFGRERQSMPSDWNTALRERFAPVLPRFLGNNAPLLPFDHISTRADMWIYVNDWLADAVVPDDNSMYLRSRLLGEIRIRQVRAAPVACPNTANPIATMVYLSKSACFDSATSLSTEYRQPFGGPNNDLYTWSDDPQVQVNRWLLAPNGAYSSAGYIVPLPRNATMVRAIISSLQSNSFVDLHTRAIFVDFTLYNPTEDLFCMVRLMFELPSYGGVKPLSSFRVTDASLYSTWVAYLMTVFQCLFMISFLEMSWVMINEIYAKGLAFFREFWCLVDFFNILIFAIIIVMTCVHGVCGILLLNSTATDKYVNWQNYAYTGNQLRNLGAFNAVLSWFRLLKYLRLSARLSMLERVFVNLKSDLIAWGILFTVIFFSFVQAFFMGFHVSIYEYRSIPAAIITLFRGVFGELDFNELQHENWLLGPLLFLSYVFIMFFIMLNLFLAILQGAWMKTEEDLQAEQEDGLGAVLTAAMHNARNNIMLAKRRGSIFTGGNLSNSPVKHPSDQFRTTRNPTELKRQLLTPRQAMILSSTLANMDDPDSSLSVNGNDDNNNVGGNAEDGMETCTD